MTDTRTPTTERSTASNFRQRRFLGLAVLGAMLAPFAATSSGNLSSPQTSSNLSCATAKPVLTANDIEYLGAIRVPATGVDARYSYGGLTGRMVNGRAHLFIYGNNVPQDPTLKDWVYELEDPGGGYTTDYTMAPRARLVTTWGDIYHGKRLYYDYDRNDGSTWFSGYTTPEGLYWNEQTHLLYWTYFNAYNVTGYPDVGLGATSLDDPNTGTSTSYGPWRVTVTDGDGATHYGPWRCLYLFGNPLDGSMMCGSHIQSGAARSPWGPDAYGGAPWPTASTPAGFNRPDIHMPNRYLEYYYMGSSNTGNYVDSNGVVHGHLRSARRSFETPVWENYAAIHNDTLRANPSTNGGVTSWSEMDATSGAAWLELSNKRGVVFVTTLAGAVSQDVNDCVNTAHVWYGNAGVNPPYGACSHGCGPVGATGPSSTAMFPSFTIYDPDDLVAVRNGSKVDYTVEPRSVIDLGRSYGIRTADVNNIGAFRTIRGIWFDPVRKYLFVLAPQSDGTLGTYSIMPLIHVFAIHD
ncbi:MAG TPA: hypothetical protein VJN96_14390 [Vicinamibacterales bacterium]|nr:hypothetical protein [Vicinamibacterales bacterium]